ncbi:799_t:CDS:1, partial [Gigaspora margarita]
KVGFIASFLGPQIKNLKFIEDIKPRENVISTVQRLCAKIEHYKPLVQVSKNDELAELSSISSFRHTVVSDLITNLYNNEKLDKITKESEVDCYICEPIQRKACNPLKW